MHNKPRNWTDVKLILSSFSIAITLGVWGLFASHEKSGTGVAGEAAISPQSDTLVPASSPALLPGQILLFGGTNLPAVSQLQTQVQAQPTQTVIVRKKHGGKGGGGGGGGGAATSSGSSH